MGRRRAPAPYARCAARTGARSSRVGIALAIGPVILLQMLGIAKQRLADTLEREHLAQPRARADREAIRVRRPVICSASKPPSTMRNWPVGRGMQRLRLP